MQLQPLGADIFAPGLKNHRSVVSRRWAIDQALATRRAAWTGLQFVVRCATSLSLHI